MTNNWETAYNQGFLVDTYNPSNVIILVQKILPTSGRVLDIGCGNGRNAIYFAKRGFVVDAIDIVDLEFTKNLSEDIVKKINFQKISCLNFTYDQVYDIIVMARLIQYLTSSELELLFEKITSSLKKDGLILLSYAATGNKVSEIYCVKKYHYSLSLVLDLAKRYNLNPINIKEGNTS